MPDITPVGAMVKPPDPMAAINSYSGILGLQQQKQALQTGQYTQQSASATADQDQQKNRELQAAQTLAMNGAQSGRYANPDGSFNRQKMADEISQVAPTYGQGIASTLLSQANEVVSNHQALQNLNQDQQKQVAAAVAPLASKPNLTHEDVINALDSIADINPATRRMAISMGASIPPNASPQQLQQYMRQLALKATSPEYNATQTQPNVQTMTAPGGMQPVNVNPQAPGGTGPVGAPMAQGVAPSVVSTPAGPLARVGGNGSTVTPLTTAAPPGQSGQPPPNLNVTTAQATTQNTAAAGVATRVQQAQAAANNTVQAQDALTRARSILDNPSGPNTGVLFDTKKAVKNFLSGVGIDTGSADDANTLVKNLARYEASRATQAGLGGTDAARDLAHQGSPNVSLDNAALKGVVTQSLATEKALSAYANVQSKTRDVDQLAKNEADFRKIPNLVQGYEYGLARTPAEAEEFLKKHGVSRADMAATRKAIKEFEAR